MLLKKYFGNEVIPYIRRISDFRIKYFKEFPYCYEGNYEYEYEYFKGFSQDDKSLVIELSDKEKIIALSTAMPLVSSADILKDAELAFQNVGLNPANYYYLGEIIVDEFSRSQGIAKLVLEKNEEVAKELGFKKMCLSVVVRREDDLRRPANYKSSDSVWEKNGYIKQNIYIDYHWPTILEDGKVEDISNEMVFWTKDI